MSQKKILLIEDDADTRQGLAIRLKANGFEIITAVDAYTGLNTAQKTKPHLIILDLGLPAGDGLKLLAKIKELPATALIPVIVLTGRDPELNKPAALNAGAVAFFQKPADVDTLLSTINSEIERSHFIPDEPVVRAGTKRKILVVEDDADTRQGLVLRLRANNYDTAIATDAVSVMSVAQSSKPDLILLDLGLPAGDGFSVLQKLKANLNLQNIPVIVLSARDPQVNGPKALEAGAAKFLQKPAESEILLAEISKLLNPQ